MKMRLTNAVVKSIVKDVRNNGFKYAIGGIYENIVIFTSHNGAMLIKAEVNEDFTNYLKQIKQPASEYQVLNDLLNSMHKYVIGEISYDDFEHVKHNGKEYISFNDLLFDPKLFTKFHSSKKYQFRIWTNGNQHGAIVDEYIYEDDMYEPCALILGVRKI